ncbi:MAG: putative zinc-binding metallopeptidase [Propionicimonas sp.]|uniref:zinc-binding metallopeptidase family protein n=1 Tax=Propionicimonas sp. TaxID=1955623 RepID=UPI003D12963D
MVLTCPNPACRGVVFLESLACDACGTPLALHAASRTMVEASSPDVEVDGRLWHPCTNRDWNCNWLTADDSGSGRCFACRLVRRRPPSDDTISLEKVALTMPHLRRLLVQLQQLGVPIDPHFEADGGLGFDLLSSRSSNEKVVIGHANGIITLDVVESLDAVREQLRVRLREPYRTMLGHLRHEAGHYYQWILVEQTGWIDECRELFGDERASYADAIARHYRTGAPDDWQDAFISEYATMHPWEDFAESFAHYLHITDTLNTAASAGVELDASRQTVPLLTEPVVPRTSYGADDFEALIRDWRWMSLFFNRVNRAMGAADLYPFRISEPVVAKLEFVHRVLTRLPETRISVTDGFRRRVG